MKMWTTEMELEYLNTIGESMVRRLPKAFLLTGYIAGSGKREDWGAMGKVYVIAHAKMLLQELA